MKIVGARVGFDGVGFVMLMLGACCSKKKKKKEKKNKFILNSAHISSRIERPLAALAANAVAAI